MIYNTLRRELRLRVKTITRVILRKLNGSNPNDHSGKVDDLRVNVRGQCERNGQMGKTEPHHDKRIPEQYRYRRLRDAHPAAGIYTQLVTLELYSERVNINARYVAKTAVVDKEAFEKYRPVRNQRDRSGAMRTYKRVGKGFVRTFGTTHTGVFSVISESSRR